MTSKRESSADADRLKQLRAFCHTARLGSITRAARHISSSQSATSQQVRALEKTLGITLFERNGPYISLTSAGRQLYQTAMPIVMGMDRLPDTFAERHHGEVTDEFEIAVGRASAAYVIPRYLKQFREQLPDVRVKVRTGTGQDRLNWLRAYEVDIAFGAADVPPPDLQFHFMFAARHIFITPEDHPLAGRKSINLAKGTAYPSVMFGGSGYIQQLVDMFARQYDLAPNPAVKVDGWNVAKYYVAAGIGVSIVPEFCLTDRDRVWRIPLDRYLPARRYGVFTRRDGILSLAAERFIEIISPDLPGQAQ